MPVDEAILTQYALGILDEEEYQMVHSEISASPMLQKQLESIQTALEYVALAENPIYPSESLRNSILDSIQEEPDYSGFISRFADLFDLDKKSSANLLAKIGHISDKCWQSTPFPGVVIMKFAGGPRVASATCGIVQVKPGKLFPAHQHQGNEKILVLKGIARDDHGKEFSAGDTFLFFAGSRHSFRIISDEPFVFAVVLHEKNKWLLIKTIIDSLRNR